MRHLIALFIMLLAAGSVSSAACGKSAHRDFMGLWEARLSQYQASFEAGQVAHREAATAIVTAINANSDNLAGVMANALSSAQHASGAARRLNTLRDFIGVMERRPAPELAQTWLRGRFADAQSRFAQLGQLEQQVGAMRAGENGVTVPQLIGLQEQVAMTYGDIEGEALELSQLAQEVDSYYSATMRETAERRAARRAFLGAFGAALQQQADQANRSWSATCVGTGNFTSCQGH